MKGLAAIPVIAIVVIIGVVGYFGYKTFGNKEAIFSFVATPSETPTPTPIVTPTPTPTLKPTVKPIPKIVITSIPSATLSSTPSPSAIATQLPGAPKSGCALYDLGGDLGTWKVTIQPESGKQLMGDAGVTISRKYPECPGVDPGFPVIQIIHQGETSTTFSGMRPGPFHIEVNYHGHSDGYDLDIHSGDNSTTVTVRE